MTRLRRLVIDRLVRYYRYLVEVSERETVTAITSSRIGRALDVDPSQVRKDFAAVGLVGMSRVGYDACEICRTIRTVLGFDLRYDGVLVGAGNLGRAILAYPEFSRYGLRIVAAFDSDPFKIGRLVEGRRILSIRDLTSYVVSGGLRLAVLATPSGAAQPLADLLVSCGVTAIWNFTPARLVVPRGVLARSERFSAGLGEIAYHLSSPGFAREAPEVAADGVLVGS